MKTRIKIKQINEFQGKIIAEVELIEGDTILKNDVFVSKEKKLKIISIGIIESDIENVYPIIIEFPNNSEWNELDGLIFEKQKEG